MSKSNNLTDFLTGVADAIRSKKGTTTKINPQNFESEIADIETSEIIEVSTLPTSDIDTTKWYKVIDDDALYKAVESAAGTWVIKETPPLSTSSTNIYADFYGKFYLWNYSAQQYKVTDGEYYIPYLKYGPSSAYTLELNYNEGGGDTASNEYYVSSKTSSVSNKSTYIRTYDTHETYSGIYDKTSSNGILLRTIEVYEDSQGLHSTENLVSILKQVADGSTSYKWYKYHVPKLQSKTATENGTVTYDSSYDGLSQVTVNVPQLDTSDATATAADMLSGKTAYVNGVKVSGNIETYDGTVVSGGGMIVDLTNTTWVLDKLPSGTDEWWDFYHSTFYIEFNGHSKLYCNDSNPGALPSAGNTMSLVYDDEIVWQLKWVKTTVTITVPITDENKTITITGGDDVTNESLVSWLNTYGTQIK